VSEFAPFSRNKKKTRLLASYFKGGPIACTWQLGRPCETHCLYCEHMAEIGNDPVSVELAESVAARLAGDGSLLISLMGSDPLLHPDITRIVSTVARWHFPFITTNGWPISAERAQALWEAGLEGVSLWLRSADLKTHDGAVGVPGSFQRVMKAARVFSAARNGGKQPVHIKLALDETGAGTLPTIADMETLLREAAAQMISVKVEIAPREDGQGARPAFRALIDALQALRGRQASLGNSAFYLARLSNSQGEGIGGCRAGRSFFNIDRRGAFARCFNYRQNTFLPRGTESAKAITKTIQKDDPASECRRCWCSWRGEVEGAYTLKGVFSALPWFHRL
jgi:MoaA/NifB/PqqE/SkfB family radical SAM enzyme